ncbi:16S rRNA (cytidine(1402)-2'-O)-methyltransferase [Caloramator australicus]|uniref:Ribosomal RNA small subunit methyltransferase I n=1 Tax=Caloramator australicus RC3 TaxID=857293 RepID=G0V4C5_9CLOT|nr:16S rRNA (cytidine(1402)-2'-O)-methyltransferase [Caloramator australicus]CCC57965.1 rRNA small subunit methyltransferase I [Caloramator australicus RC3]
MSGEIYLVATPIGNLGDITLRALEVLKEVDFIAAEDTRQTLKLLNHFGIKKPLISYHEHNKYESGEKIIKRVLEGENMALVTDAGTPGVSDPGEALVKMAIEKDIKVSLIPGPTAFVYGLVVSGLNTSRFVFEGFLPVDKKGRKERLNALLNEERTIIFYEAPHKLIRTLEDLYKTFGDRRIAICRELTKKYEEIIRCTLSEAIEIFKEKKPLGEFVLVLEGLSKEEAKKRQEESLKEISIEEQVKLYMEDGLPKMDAIKKVAKEMGLSKSEVYRRVLDL